MKNIPYASAVGSLMYVQVCTRLDIAFVVEMLGRYHSNPDLLNGAFCLYYDIEVFWLK